MEAHMKNSFFGIGLALGLGLAAAATADDDTTTAAKGTPVTLTGCVAGSDSDSFVLTHVQNAATPTSTGNAVLGATGMEPGPGEPIYWLSHNSVKLMRGHVGHKVEVTGTVTDVSTGTVKIKEQPGKPGADNKVEVEARGKDATARTDAPVEPGPSPRPGTKVEKKMTGPVHRIAVDSVRMIAATCP
jgi:hypothetical protein